MVEFINLAKNLESFGYEISKNIDDRCYAQCSIGKHDILTTFRSLKRTVKKRGTYRCIKCYSNSEEGKSQRSEQSKKLWSDPVLSKLVSQKSKESANSESGKKQRSIQAKKAWEDSEYAELQKNRINELFRSEKHRKLVSERNKSDYRLNPEKYLTEKVSVLRTEEAKEAHKLALAKPEYRETHRKLALERFKNPEYKAKIAAGLEGFSRGGNKSNPEITIEEILNKLGVSFVYNKAVGPYNFDFYIESVDLFIEVQGEYWHTLPNNEKRDKSKYSYLKNSRPDSKIIYIWDYDILTGSALDKIQEALGILKFELNDFELKSVSIKTTTNDEAKKFLNTWHYAQFGKVAKFIVGAFLDNELIGVVKFGPVSRKEIATSLGNSTKEVFELDRLCIHPMRQKKNFASYLISRATSLFFKEFPESKKLVSFADETFGHDGTVYKACNWKLVSKVKPDYVYVREDGWTMHKKTLYNQARSVHLTERAYAEKNGWKKVFGKEKSKFVLKRS